MIMFEIMLIDVSDHPQAITLKRDYAFYNCSSISTLVNDTNLSNIIADKKIAGKVCC